MRAHVVGWTERATGDASIEPGGFAGADETRRVSVVVVGETVEIGRASIGGFIVIEGTVVGVVVFELVADVVLAAGEVVVSAVVVVVLDAEGANVVLVDAAGRAHATERGKDVVEGATAFRACACGGGYAFFLAVGGSIFEYSWFDGGRTRRLPWPHPPPVEIACDHDDSFGRRRAPPVAVARCCDGSVVAWAAGGEAYEVMSGDLAAKGVRCRSARVFGGSSSPRRRRATSTARGPARRSSCSASSRTPACASRTPGP